MDQWKNMCLNKSRYSDEFSARAASQHVLIRGFLNTPEKTVSKMWVYRCENCRGWHMTKSPTVNAPVTETELVLSNGRKL